MPAAIEFQHVSKQFVLHSGQPRPLQRLARRLLRRVYPPHELFPALDDASFAVEQGKTVGLIGANGSGKSTALKMVAGILQPSAGTIFINGRVSALLELGAGMHPDLTGRENVALNGSMLGFSNREMAQLYPEIVEFAELGRFMDVPVKHYSSGMYMRLGFSVATHVQPDILLLDEVLAVGDQAFQNKCLDRLYSMKRHGVTILIVNHNADALREMCDELVWLKDGRVMQQGIPSNVINAYLYDLHRSRAQPLRVAQPSELPPDQRWGSHEAEVTAVRLLDRSGQPAETFYTGEPLTVEMDYLAHQPLADPMFGLAIHHADGTHINGPNNKVAGVDLPPITGRGTVRYTVAALPLLAGAYDVSVSLYDGRGAHAYDVQWRAYPFHVSADDPPERFGLVYMPARWQHAPAPVQADGVGEAVRAQTEVVTMGLRNERKTTSVHN